ncbi:MAG: DNA alkylation repair protein [Myxococcota bacterium]
MATALQVERALRELGSKEHATVMQRFFKTGPGEYGEGDRFIGVKVPVIRKVAKQCRDVELAHIETLLDSPIHEVRLCALFIMNLQFERGGPKQQAALYKLYVRKRRCINNWDLVDGSAHRIVGPYLETRSRAPLYKWARAKHLWTRRIAIMSTLHFIKQGDFDDTLAISELLLHDEHDLIHKAAGWMLREVGNRDRAVEEAFLKAHYREMPRTMLRYAIERLPERRRKAYLQGRV